MGPAPQPPGVHPTTTLAAETGNNTSAADSFRGQSNGNAAAANVSKLPIQSLLYAGSTTKVYAHLMGWFGGSNHIDVGYASDNQAQVHRQVVDMISRGVRGAILDWNGPSSTRINTVANLLKQEAEAQNGNFEFAIMEDGGALSEAAMGNHCDVTDQIIDDLNYIAAHFAGSSAYLKSNGRPVVFFFGVDNYYIDWDRVESSVSNNPILIFRGKSGFSHAHTDGSFQWVDLVSSDPFDAQLSAQDQFYQAAVSAPSKMAFGSAYAGFNDTLAGWSTDRFVHQQCGETWLATMNVIAQFYSASRQLPAMQLVTWNDYEEGTALESGIDNCVYLAPSLSGNSLTWSVAGGSESTVDHYTVFVSTDGQNLAKLGDVASGTHSFDLTQSNLAAATYKLYVKAVGRASFQNKMSPAVGYRKDNQPPKASLALTSTGSLTIKASTDGSSDPDGSVASSSIDFGDGTVLSGTNATHTYTSPGTYTVVATVVDNVGISAVAVKRTSVKATASGVTIFAPADGATVNWPTSFVASADSGSPVTSMKVLVDGQAVYSIDRDTINTTLKIYRGSHHIVVQATDSSGTTTSAAIDVVAQPGDLAPIAAMSTLPLPGVAPNTVLACTAGSKDPDGFLISRQVKFSDGTTVKAAGAVHTFASPGTYSATATVTDQFGVSDSVTETVVVGAGAASASENSPQP